ncbi:uncharacterized protein LOC105694278 [Orussus abietinus]|uniref:uncharacterized protein LOC105694278 n=1 Tax=Orussus abietinus TaxID=222816 RepID=UPI000625D7D7|nr:uncharacterized protein LOC105694278 [Orussus abietinus]
MVVVQIMTPEEYKRRASKLNVSYTYCNTPFGKCLLGTIDEAVCHLSFVIKNDNTSLEYFQHLWPGAQIAKESTKLKSIVQDIFPQDTKLPDDSVRILLRGTEFQIAVWKALIALPTGSTTVYEEIAASIGKPKAVRAAANAIAFNQIAYLVPCHRVMGKSGSNKYAWGIEVKNNILKYETKCLEWCDKVPE